MKKGASHRTELDQKISQLELKQTEQLADLKESASSFFHRISPATIVKNAMRNIIATPGLRRTAIDTAISAGAGLLGKKLLVRNSANIFRKITGIAVQFVVSNYVRNKMPVSNNKVQHNGNRSE